MFLAVLVWHLCDSCFFSYSFQDQCVQDVGGSFVQAGTGRGSEAFDVVEFAKSQVGGGVIEVI